MFVCLFFFRELYVMLNLVVRTCHLAVIILICVLHLAISWDFFVFGLKLLYLGR